MVQPQGSTLRLTGLLRALTDLPDRDTALQRAVEQVAQGLDAVVTGLVLHGEVLAAAGAPVDGRLLAARLSDGAPLLLEGRGPVALVVVTCDEPAGARLVVGRCAERPFDEDELALLTAMSLVLGLALQARRLVDDERSSRARSDADAEDKAHLLASLQERQTLLERLSRIQRSINARQPLHEVLDAIVAGTTELLGEDIVGLRLLDPDDPTQMVVASVVGIAGCLPAALERQPVGQGVGGRAIRDNALIVVADYQTYANPLPGFVEDGIRAAMAAPVRRGDQAVGSLVVATRRADRVYSTSEQEVLTAFAEHVSLALNDAQAVDALRRAVAEATHQSLHDSLTGLPNRSMFLGRLTAAAERSTRNDGSPYALLFVDLDDFKVVNDSLGHLVGDQLLTAVAGRVSACLRPVDTVARLGGDEFAVLLEDSTIPAAQATAERLLDALRTPFDLPDATSVRVSASVGVVTTTGRQGSAEELLRDADVAMYRAKGDGKHRYVVFEQAMRDRLQARNLLECELHQAVASAEFVVHYQPVVDAASSAVVSTEALVRWQHPRRGLVPPAEFVPLAEATGLIVPIGSTVLHEACRQTAQWRSQPGLHDLTVSVNLSPRQLQEDGLVEDVRAALSGSGLPAGALVLEITETLLVGQADAAATRLDELKALGVRLAVDDFGTGYSSLSYLSQLPVDILKVDRSFVGGIADGGPLGTLAYAIIALAGSMSLETVAEGVETPEQSQALVASGCTNLQGSLLSRPVPAEALPGVVAELHDRLALIAASLAPSRAPGSQDTWLVGPALRRSSRTAGTTAAPTAPGCPG